MEAKNKALNHFDDDGKAIMVDVGNKPISEREATASCYIQMLPETLSMIELGSSSKGDVLGVARVAGIQGAKKCPDLIPLCHPLPLNAVSINFVIDSNLNRIKIEAVCKVSGKTGVEMEAMCAVSVAALTVYDMCKSVDRGMSISEITLEAKSGGASGVWVKEKHD